MAMRPNYGQKRAMRARAQEAKKQEKLRRREEEAAKRKALREGEGETDADGSSTAEDP